MTQGERRAAAPGLVETEEIRIGRRIGFDGVNKSPKYRYRVRHPRQCRSVLLEAITDSGRMLLRADIPTQADLGMDVVGADTP